jgi:hypothetical protein
MADRKKLEHDKLCKALSDERTRDVLVHAMLEADGDFTVFIKGFRESLDELQESDRSHGTTAQRAAFSAGGKAALRAADRRAGRT